MSNRHASTVQVVTIPPLDINAVGTLLIYHLDNSVSTPAALSPVQLEQFPLVDYFETNNPTDFTAAYAAISSGMPRINLDPFFDARWGIIFLGSGRQRLLSVYMEDSGVRAAIEGAKVIFSNQALLSWLKKRF